MSDFNHIWLDRPYNELTDEQLKAVADWHQGWGNKDQHRACVHMMALRTELTAERERADRAEGALRELGKHPEECADDGGACVSHLAYEDCTAERDALRERLREMSRAAEALKRPCGMDPESSQARRNLEYQDVANIGWRAALEGK